MERPEKPKPQVVCVLEDMESDECADVRPYNSEKAENHYESSPVKMPGKPPLPTSVPPAPTNPVSTHIVTSKANWLQYMNTALIVVVIFAVASITMSEKADNDNIRVFYDEQLRLMNASFHRRIENYTSNLEARFTRLHVILSGDDEEESISLLDFAKLVEGTQENFTAVFTQVQRVDSLFQEHVSKTSTTIATLQQHTLGLVRDVSLLNTATQSIDNTLMDFAEEARTNATTFANSFESFDGELRGLELEAEELARNVTELSYATEQVDTELTNLAAETTRNTTSFRSSLSNISSDLGQLEQATRELARNFTDATELVDARVSNLASETRRNATLFTNSLGNVSSSLRDLELETKELERNFTDALELTKIRLLNLAAETRRNATSLSNHLGNISTDLRQLEVDTTEQAQSITQLESASAHLDTRLVDFADEARTNATAFSTSLAALSSNLRELERETSRNVSLLNSSLRRDIQGLSTRLSDARRDLHGLVNQSSAEIFLHIEREILDVRGRIATEASDVRSLVANRVSDIRGEINSQVSEMREYIDDQDSNIRGRITTSIDDVSRDIDSKIRGVEGIIDRKVRNERQYVDSEIYRLEASGALPMHSCGLVTISVITLLSLVLFI